MKEPWTELTNQTTGCLKFMVLFFYRRLKADEWRQTVLTVKRLFWINGLAYLALFLTAMLGCRPYMIPQPKRHFWFTEADYVSTRFHNNWVVRPLPSYRCTFRPQNFWVLVILNVLTDGLIMTIPVPILWQLRISKLRKVGVSPLLCSGIFVISTAVVRAVFTIAGAPSVVTINRWGCEYFVCRISCCPRKMCLFLYLSFSSSSDLVATLVSKEYA